MKTGMIAAFATAIVLFVLSYIARDDGYLGLLYLLGGGVLAISGIYMAYAMRKKE